MHLSLIHPPMFLSLAYVGINHSHFHILISIYFFLKSTNIYLILSLSPYLTTSPPFPSPTVHWSLLQSPRSPLSGIFLPLHPNLSLLTDNNLWDTLTDNIHHQPFNFKLQTHIPVCHIPPSPQHCSHTHPSKTLLLLWVFKIKQTKIPQTKTTCQINEAVVQIYFHFLMD